MQKKSIYALIALCLIMAWGCAHEQLTPAPDRAGTLDDLTFIGSVKGAESADWSSRTQGATLTSESLIYGDIGSGEVLTRGIIVRTYSVRGASADFLPILFADSKGVFDAGSIRIEGNQYKYALVTDSTILRRNEQTFIDSKGYTTSECYLIKGYSGRLAGLLDKSKTHILYFERIPDAAHGGISCAQRGGPDSLSPTQRVTLSEFGARGDAYVRTFRGAGKVKEETAVSTEPVREKTAVTVPAQEKTETQIERKLRTLKGLLDKGLITKEDYNGKKQELLKNF